MKYRDPTSEMMRSIANFFFVVLAPSHRGLFYFDFNPNWFDFNSRVLGWWIMKQCSDCKYYDSGVCRRRPPVVADRTRWPWVNVYDWCGEFNPKVKK